MVVVCPGPLRMQGRPVAVVPEIFVVAVRGAGHRRRRLARGGAGHGRQASAAPSRRRRPTESTVAAHWRTTVAQVSIDRPLPPGSSAPSRPRTRSRLISAGGVRVGRIAGIPIIVSFSWLLSVLLITVLATPVVRQRPSPPVWECYWGSASWSTSWAIAWRPDPLAYRSSRSGSICWAACPNLVGSPRHRARKRSSRHPALAFRRCWPGSSACWSAVSAGTPSAGCC